MKYQKKKRKKERKFLERKSGTIPVKLDSIIIFIQRQSPTWLYLEIIVAERRNWFAVANF